MLLVFQLVATDHSASASLVRAGEDFYCPVESGSSLPSNVTQPCAIQNGYQALALYRCAEPLALAPACCLAHAMPVFVFVCSMENDTI